MMWHTDLPSILSIYSCHLFLNINMGPTGLLPLRGQAEDVSYCPFPGFMRNELDALAVAALWRPFGSLACCAAP